MKKIVFYIYSLNKGGAERVLLTIAEKMKSASNVDILILTDTVDLREYGLPDGIRRVVINDEIYQRNGSVKKLGRILAIRKIIMRERPDEVVAFMLSNAIRAVIALLGTRYKVIATVRSNPYDDYGETRKRRQLCRVLSRAKCIICQTEEQRDFFGKLKKKCFVIYNPIFDDFCIENTYSGDSNEIVATGRLFDYKNHILLIRAFSDIAMSFPLHRLIIWGEGPYRSEIEKEIVKLSEQKKIPSLTERILLPGDSQNVVQDIKNAQIYVLPSDTEGMPNSLMEAMALGLPCIATDCPGGGPRSLITSGENGFLVPIGDRDELAFMMKELIEHRELRDKISQNAKKIKEICNSDKIVNEWKQVLSI